MGKGKKEQTTSLEEALIYLQELLGGNVEISLSLYITNGQRHYRINSAWITGTENPKKSQKEKGYDDPDDDLEDGDLGQLDSPGIDTTLPGPVVKPHIQHKYPAYIG